jgi:3-oxoacyl-[acyl-carrier protein] reductase
MSGAIGGSRPVALITGAGQGIGRATALEFAARGYDLALVDCHAESLAAAAEETRRAGAAVQTFHGDVGDLAFGEGAVHTAAEEWGRLDCLVNNAAWRELATMRHISLESWERTLRVCLTAPAFLARAAARRMEQAGRGVIVNVSSIMSRRAAGTSPAYVAAKGGLDALTSELAALYGPRGIRVVAVNPGAVDTALSGDYADPKGQSLTADLRAWSEDHIPLGRWAAPAEVARAIVWLASDDCGYVTGTCLTIDGGWSTSHMPQGLKRRMHPDDF